MEDFSKYVVMPPQLLLQANHARARSLLMQRAEIYLASFPFGDVPGMQGCPVLLLTPPIGSGAEVLVASIP